MAHPFPTSFHQVNLRRSQSYGLKSGTSFIRQLEDYHRNHFGSAPALFIIDECVHALWKQTLESIAKQLKARVYVVPSGEKHKNTAQWLRLVEAILSDKPNRKTVCYVFGGGVTGDLGGFVAASVLRGLPLVHVPTTLLAMVDSSIGGKTGVNDAMGKNLIGAFYQPKEVLIDSAWLQTLPKEEWKCGWGEIIKYGMIAEPHILDELLSLMASEPEDHAKWIPLIQTCAKIKAHIVEEDELESGQRAFLNFGHTFAHALESETGYGVFSHGEAVYWGMIAAAELGEALGFEPQRHFLIPFYESFKRNTYPKLSVDRLVERMASDKKVDQSGRLRFVLLNRIADPQVMHVEPISYVESAWNTLFSLWT